MLHCFDGNVIVAPVEGDLGAPRRCQSKLETHLWVSHQVAILFAVMGRQRDCRKTAWPGFVSSLDDQSHIRRVLDFEVQAVVPTSGLLEDLRGWSALGRLREFQRGFWGLRHLAALFFDRRLLALPGSQRTCCWMTSKLSI